MDKRKLLRVGFIVLVAAAVVALIIFATVKIKDRNNGSKTAIPKAKVQTKQEIATNEAKRTNYNKVLEANNAGDHKETIKLGKAYGQEASNGTTERLTSYLLCIGAAVALKDNTSKRTCYDEGKKLAETLTVEADKKSWLKALEDQYNGKTPSGSTDNDRAG